MFKIWKLQITEILQIKFMNSNVSSKKGNFTEIMGRKKHYTIDLNLIDLNLKLNQL